MLDTIDTTTTDAGIVDTQEAKTDTQDTPELDSKDKLIEQLKKEAYDYRQKLKALKSTVEELTEAKTQLESVKVEWERDIAERKAKERESLISTELDKASILEDKARQLAIKVLNDYEDVSEGMRHILTEYPFLAGKSKVVLPDTGKATTKDTPVADKDKLAAGLAQLINQYK